MPKNAVQRLQKLHNELKSVISIYDAAKSTNNSTPESIATKIKDKKSEKSDNDDKSPTSEHLTDKLKILETEPLSLKKGSVEFEVTNPRGEEPSPWPEFRGPCNWPCVKPGSAPSYTSTSTQNYESDFIVGSSRSENVSCEPETERSQNVTSETNSDGEFSIYHEKKTFKIQDKQKRQKEQLFHVPSCEKGLNGFVDCSDDHESKKKMNLKPGWDFEFRKPSRSRSESPRKELLYEPVERPITSTYKSLKQNEKIVLKAVQPRHENSKFQISNLKKRKFPEEANHRITSRLRMRHTEKENKTFKSEEESDTDSNKRTDKRMVEDEKFKNRIISKRDLTQVKGPTKTSSNCEKKEPENSNPKTSEFDIRSNNTQLKVDEIFRIIEKSNEKLEKMKVSKNLAVDIAKQLKNKYEEIKKSKDKLIDRLQKVEKDNERLNSEVKKEKKFNGKLKKNVEQLKSESRTMLLEHELKTGEVINENSYLKAKIKELEQKEADPNLKKKLSDKTTSFDQPQQQKFTSNLHKHRNDFSEEIFSPDRLANTKKDKRCTAHKNFKWEEEDAKRLTIENSQLLLKIEELSILLQDRQFQINSLENKMRNLEDDLRKQNQNLKQKTDRLEETNKELESIRENSKGLEEQVKSLRQSIDNFDQMHQNIIGKSNQYENQIKKLQEQISQMETEKTRLKTDLENEKDSLLIKNKIIEDQQETIKQLREKSDDVKNLIKKNQSLERMISIERDEKMELQDAVERLKQRKEELKRKIKSIEGDLLLAPQEVVRDLQKTQIVLHELENQVQIKQKEWELHLQSLIREKEQACSVAEFATKKLMQRTSEFQKQSEAQKRLHKVLAENLAKKERYLREMNDKISQNQLREMLAQAEEETKRLVRLTALPNNKETDANVWPREGIEAITAMRYGDGVEKRKFQY